MFCPECSSAELEEYDDFYECPECGAQFDIDSDEDEIIPLDEEP